ncbi:MAG: hypothetical protein GKS05_01375 [Nitrospirales bacterium]|nr:hypothetical protein [Nitrospirales bacterium]
MQKSTSKICRWFFPSRARNHHWNALIILSAAVFSFVGCASVETQTYPQLLWNKSLTKPERLLIYDFAISPDQIQIDEGFGADITKLVKGAEGNPKKTN